ncbi:LysR family transcriptional regulator [Scleromatobacter humisilvae]|uniref:LysR family transcriptional regulator n=1 Tax=Scleromatobacter humisilvae TaxID=2897159 RepID=A0A9X1YII6_9BURK|nr:LysR family transcriptional regulator [Scleromatobacter humisilvae]MCK9685363.1 LysR family transcriptional regulator [Scleromatobacter humisilvae]
MDWDNARVFLAIYRRGTLRGAAAELQIDQATAGRRLAALESALEARLFLRTPKRYLPTPAGELALHAAEQMEAGALALQRQMQGVDERPEGLVSLACTDTIATVFLMPALAALRRRHPGVVVRLIASTQLSNLTRREADLAVRSVRPEAPDLIARHLGQRAVGLYASADYLARRSLPEPGNGLAGHDIVVYDRGIRGASREQLCQEPTHAASAVLEVNSGMMLGHAVAAGLGIGELPTHLAALFPSLRRIWPDRAEPYDMWLVLHGDLHRTARVRAVADAVVEAFAMPTG